MHKAITLSLFAICAIAFSAPSTLDQGMVLYSWPIGEKDPRETIAQELTDKPPTWAQNVEAHFRKLDRVSGLQRAETFTQKLFDPSYKADEEIRDHNGILLVARGAKINPLDQIHLDDGLLLFDATDPTQISWARQQTSRKYKWILTEGDPAELEESEDRPIYFDQKGAICAHFQISTLPTRIYQQGNQLLIESMPPWEVR